MNNSVTLFANGQRYDLPDSEVANFRKTAEASNIPVEDGQSFRTKDGDTYTIPSSQIEAFRAAAPDAESVRPFRFADNSTKYMTMPELSKFLRSKEWREGDEYKADREERDRAVNAKMGGDGEMHSPTWAAIKGAVKGAATGFWEGGNAAANKIAKAIPEIGVSLESALGNALNLGGNAPNAVGNWFLADAKSGKAWLDAHLPDSAKDWTGYEDWSTKTADKFAEVSAMGYKFAPAMATGGSTALVSTMFASDGLNAASQTFDNAINSGYTPAEANAAAAASFLVNYYGAKLVTKAGGVAESFSNPLLRFLGGGAGVATTMGMQNAANRGVENVTGGRIDEATGLPDRKIRPITEGMGDAFVEGNVEGWMFHGINAIPGAVVGGANMAAQRMRETRELKEYRKDSLLAVARGEDGGELLDTLLPTRGLDAAIRARKGGADVSRKMAQGADLPDNMSVAERNEVIDAIIKARGERAAQNAVKVDGFRAEALDAAIKEVGGEGEVAQDIRARVISKLKNARELDDPFRREELVGEAFEEYNKEHPKPTEIKPNETRNGADEKPAQPKPPVETRAEGPEAVRPVEGEPPRGEAPRPDVVKPAEKPTEPPQGSQEPPAPPKTGEDTPRPAEGVEAASRASDANGDWTPPRPALLEKGNEKRFSDGDKVVGWRRIYNPGITTPKTEDVNGVFMGMSSEGEALIRTEKGSYVRVDPRTLKTPEEFAEDAAKNEAQNRAIAKRMTEGVIPREEIDRLLGMSPEDIAKADIKFEQPAKPIPDGKGKMVKPKAAESDYGVTMFEEPAVDGDGVSYVVKDGPSDAHRMMFKSKAEAEARLAELRAKRKAIMESPSATLADGTKVHLLKTDEGWVPYNENYVDLRRGLFKAAKTKAGAIKVAEKGVKWAKDVAEFDSAYKRFEEDFGLDEFNEKVGWGNENGEGWNESAALEHLRQFDLEKLKDMKERAKRFNLGHHNGRNEKIQEWFDKVISEKSPIPDGKGKMVKPKPTEPPKTTAPVVDETGKTAEVAPPDSVEAKISAMKRGSPEQLKAQKEYFETEIAKAEEAIKGKLDEPTKKKVGSKWVNEWKPKKDAGEVPPSVTIKIPGDGEFTVPNNPDGIARLKKVAAKFKPAPKKGVVETDSTPREPSLKPAEKPKIESAEKETALFVSDGKREPLRKSVSKPFSDGEYVYATDGRMMVRRPLRKGEKVNGEKDAPIDATHKVIKEATANRENDTKIKVSVSELYPKLIQAGVIADLRPDYLKKGAIQLWRGSDGKLQIRTRDDAGNEYFTDGLSKSSKPLAQIQGEYLQNFLKLVAKSGGGEIEISVKDAESPLLLKGGGWDAVLIPLRTDDSPKSSPASKAKEPASDIQPQKPLGAPKNDYSFVPERLNEHLSWIATSDKQAVEDIAALRKVAERNIKAGADDTPSEMEARDLKRRINEENAKARARKKLADEASSPGLKELYEKDALHYRENAKELRDQLKELERNGIGEDREEVDWYTNGDLLEILDSIESGEASTSMHFDPYAIGRGEVGPFAEALKNLAESGNYKGKDLERLNRLAKKINDAYKAIEADIEAPRGPWGESLGDTIADLDRLIAEEEAGGGAAPSGKAEGLPSRAENFAPGPGTKGFFSRLVSKNSIVRAIKDNFPEFAIRGKNTTNIGKNYNGHFEPWRELIRSKDMSSIDTIPHEIGHGISMIAKRKMMNIPQEVKRELAKWGRDLYGNKRPAAGYMEEGFAEYVRGYMTGAEDLATQAPHLDAWFRNSFAKKNPDFVRRMDRVRAEVMRWRMQNDVQKVAAMQNPETSAARRAWDKVKSVFTQEAWNDEGATLTKGYKKSGLDSLHEWREDFRQLEKLVKSGQDGSQAAKDLAAEINRKILSDPRIFASNARGTSKARVLDMAKYGVTNLTGTEKIGDVTGFDANGKPIRNNNTESYRDIFGDFTKKELADFDVYAAAKVGLENYVKKGREFGMDQATLERVVAKLESPRFLNALERFTAFSRRALSVGLEAGALTPEQYQKIVGEHKYYVRTERRIAEDGAGTGGRQQNPIKAIKGSTRNIVPPRTATLMQIEKQLRYFQTMKTLNMIARDVLQAEKANEAFFKNGTGRDYKIGANLPVKVPNARESVKFKSDKLRKQVVDALNKAGAQGSGGETGDALFDQLFADGDAPLTVFRERPSDGRHGLVSTYIDGKLVTFELPDAAWEKYITGMEKGNGGFDNKVGDALWNVATATPKLLRLGATTLNPVFATANFMRDTFHAAIMSESGALPLVSSVSGMMNDVLGKDAGRLFRSMGGEMAMLMGANPEAQAKHMSEVALAKGLLGNIEANTTLLSPLSGVSRVIADVLSKPEMGPRVREVMGVMKRAQAAGLDREASAWLAFAAGKDISIDFGKHGYLMKRLNQLIPYTNAWYRGLEQFARKMGVTNALPAQFEERRSVNLARTATRALVTLSATAVANSIASLLLMDEKERRAQFNKTPREKWEYDDILGTVRVPLPFELGAVFYAIPKAMVYEAFGDKGAVKEAIWHGLSTNVGKYSSVQDFLSGITLIAPFVDNLRNAKWDGAPVVAPHIKDAYAKDPQMWYDHSTTEIAKWAGEKLDWAPAHIDHVANTWTGGMWKRFLSPASDTTLSTATGFSTFRPRPTARRDVRDFYEFRSEAQSHYNAGNASLEDIGRLRRANKLHEEIAPLFKEARELGSSGLSQSERNKRREAIMDEVFDKIHEWRVAETNDRKGGIAKAADALTSSVEISDDVRSRNLAVLKGISYEEAADALKAYGREKMQTPVRNSRGFKTGRMKTHPRWTNETIQKRLRILRRIMNENGD